MVRGQNGTNNAPRGPKTASEGGQLPGTVAASLIPQKLFPSLFSSLSEMRKLLGYTWLATVGDTQLNSFQTATFAEADASHRVFFLERPRELARGMEDAFQCGTAGPQEGL